MKSHGDRKDTDPTFKMYFIFNIHIFYFHHINYIISLTVQVTALHPQLGQVENLVNSDVDVMGKLRQQVVDLAKHRSIKILETSSKDFQVYLFGFKSFKRGFWDVCLRNFNVLLPTGFLYSPSSSNVTLSWCSTAP